MTFQIEKTESGNLSALLAGRLLARSLRRLRLLVVGVTDQLVVLLLRLALRILVLVHRYLLGLLRRSAGLGRLGGLGLGRRLRPRRARRPDRASAARWSSRLASRRGPQHLVDGVGLVRSELGLVDGDGCRSRDRSRRVDLSDKLVRESAAADGDRVRGDVVLGKAGEAIASAVLAEVPIELVAGLEVLGSEEVGRARGVEDGDGRRVAVEEGVFDGHGVE
ncbi:hypothetical protein K466DRAFT_410107 [Polyporus arcularius HHB13444]|uniref:Uncharacterized protein n=1 Tax=Polyporus arcularius HHB13444 TaxID=1314778 RepID=A0A5C3NS33_9APHY|nr:hypothetical protein K466DRAFT_410107 [Polyporus arcularius HHB13444]